MSGPRRFAHLWTPEELASVEIDGEWPEEIQYGKWVYRIELGLDRQPIVTRGRFSGTEFLDYKARRPFVCDDVPAYLEADSVRLVVNDDDGKQPRAHRSSRTDDDGGAGRNKPRGPYRRRDGKSARPQVR